MRTLFIVFAITVIPAAAFAQSRAYVNGAGGFATTGEGTSGNVAAEAGQLPTR